MQNNDATIESLKLPDSYSSVCDQSLLGELAPSQEPDTSQLAECSKHVAKL